MKPEQSKPTVTVEDLLRLKRAERPSEEFWTRFEKELHTRQLAACIEPRPWWLGLSLVWRKASPLALPAGALAALALSVVTVQRVAFHTSPDSAPSTVIASNQPSARASDPVSPSATAGLASSTVPVSTPATVSADADETSPVEAAQTRLIPPSAPTAILAATTTPANKPTRPQSPQPAATETPSATPLASSPALVETTAVASLLPSSSRSVNSLVISPSDHLLTSNIGWLSDHAQHEATDLSTALVSLASLPLLAESIPTVTTPDTEIASIRGNSRLARLISTESYVTTDDASNRENPQRNTFRRVNDDDVLPSAVRRLVGGGDRVSFRF